MTKAPLDARRELQAWLSAGQAALHAPSTSGRSSRRICPTLHATAFVPALPGLKHILVDAGGRQHLLLRNYGAVLQLMVEGAEVAHEPVVLKFLVHGPAALGPASRQLATLRRILAPTSPSVPATPRWTDHTLKRRGAVDGPGAGDPHP
jgi:hypothetical protein